jgi:hypothetical protein
MTFSMSASGQLAYRATGIVGRRQIWLDRTGKQIGLLGAEDLRSPCCARFSTDGLKVGYIRGEATGILMRMNVADGSESSLPRGSSGGLVFSPNSDEVLVTALGISGATITRVLPDGVLKIPIDGVGSFHVQDQTADGSMVLFRRISINMQNPQDAGDLLAVSITGGEPTPVASGPGLQINGRFSPDSHWVIYQSDHMQGRPEIFVQRFPGSAESRPIRVSTDGGTIPQWSRDGKEIYFLSADDHVMVANVTFDSDIRVTAARPLFSKPLRHGSTFEMAPDGRLLVNTPIEDPAPIILLSKGAGRVFQ